VSNFSPGKGGPGPGNSPDLWARNTGVGVSSKVGAERGGSPSTGHRAQAWVKEKNKTKRVNDRSRKMTRVSRKPFITYNPQPRSHLNSQGIKGETGILTKAS